MTELSEPELLKRPMQRRTEDGRELARGETAPRRAWSRVPIGLSAKLLLSTIAFVMLSVILIYVPSLANYRRAALNDRLAAAQVAALVLDAAPKGSVPKELEIRLLNEVGAAAVAVKKKGMRRLLAAADQLPPVERNIDLRDISYWRSMMDTIDTLAHPEQRYIRVIGPGSKSMDFVELVLNERPIRNGMLHFSIRLLMTSLVISAITAGLVYVTLHLLIVRPVRRLSANITRFAADPDDATRIIDPSERGDEIGMAEQALADMERSLARELREKKHLAALGLAVNKVGHDLRNMLASAQLMSDRLANLPDPAAQRFAPKLIATLDRAIAFCQSTLTYGRAIEDEPQRQRILLEPFVEELRHGLGFSEDGPIRFTTAIPHGLTIHADPDQLYRVLLNLTRNAFQALDGHCTPERPGHVTIEARRQPNGVVIEVVDDGPGVPEAAKAMLFEPFGRSNKRDGSGLGLAIAAELVRLHGGTIALAPSDSGARFRIELPDVASSRPQQLSA